MTLEQENKTFGAERCPNIVNLYINKVIIIVVIIFNIYSAIEALSCNKEIVKLKHYLKIRQLRH